MLYLNTKLSQLLSSKNKNKTTIHRFFSRKRTPILSKTQLHIACAVLTYDNVIEPIIAVQTSRIRESWVRKECIANFARLVIALFRY